MARDEFANIVGSSGPGEEAGVVMHSSAGLLLLSMVIFSLFVISMVIFACGDDNSGKSRPRRDGFRSGGGATAAGAGTIGGGGCGGGGGGGCGGGGGGGCGGGGGSGGGCGGGCGC